MIYLCSQNNMEYNHDENSVKSLIIMFVLQLFY
nr:MAG TPA: hypothetical protein [Caudoviricetes sp.]